MGLDHTAAILVTGGSGFAGSHLVEALLAQGFSNINITSFGSRVNSPPAGVEIHQVDLTDRPSVEALFAQLKPEAIYHLASFAAVSSSFDKAEQVLHNNLSLQLNVLEALKTHVPQSRMLMIGSAVEYGNVSTAEGRGISETAPLNPVNPYGVSKVTQDLLSQMYTQTDHLQIVRARPFNHIGERQSPDFAVPSFAQQIVAIERRQQTEIRVGNLTAIRDFTDVKDMVKAYILLMERGVVGEVYNIGSGRGYVMAEVLEMMKSLAQVPIPVVEDPAKIRPLDVAAVIADNGKIASLGWQPEIALPQTLERIIAYWRTQS